MKKNLGERIFDFCSEGAGHIVLIDGLEGAFIGCVRRGQISAACYDYKVAVKLLVEDNGLTEMEACAYIEENIDKNWVGANTPFFMRNF
jgi:hypothetical protein